MTAAPEAAGLAALGIDIGGTKVAGGVVAPDGTILATARRATPGASVADTEDALVDYFRCIAGEHSDWAEYREAMRRQGKSLIRVTIESWGPIATGGFPADRAPA